MTIRNFWCFPSPPHPAAVLLLRLLIALLLLLLVWWASWPQSSRVLKRSFEVRTHPDQSIQLEQGSDLLNKDYINRRNHPAAGFSPRIVRVDCFGVSCVDRSPVRSHQKQKQTQKRNSQVDHHGTSLPQSIIRRISRGRTQIFLRAFS